MIYCPARAAATEARIVTLTPAMAVQGIHVGWWSDPVLKSPLEPLPIDRHWDWNHVEIEYEGRVLAAEKAALVVGDDPAVQGAMMISAGKVPSALTPGQHALFLELLFPLLEIGPTYARTEPSFSKASARKC